MAEITIRFRKDGVTGKKEIVIHLESEADVLGHEHEKDHQALVEKLIGRSLNEDDGEIKVERITKEGAKVGQTEGTPAPQREGVKEGGGG